MPNLLTQLVWWWYSNIYTRCNVTQFLYLETALRVSGGSTTHHQECKQLCLQHLVFVTPLLLPAAIVEELELVWVCCGWRNPTTDAGNHKRPKCVLCLICSIYVHCGPGSVVGIATGLRAGRSGDRIPVEGEIFRTCPDRPWGPPSLLYNGYRVFPWG
jgi:hypothetical protein